MAGLDEEDDWRIGRQELLVGRPHEEPMAMEREPREPLECLEHERDRSVLMVRDLELRRVLQCRVEALDLGFRGVAAVSLPEESVVGRGRHRAEHEPEQPLLGPLPAVARVAAALPLERDEVRHRQAILASRRERTFDHAGDRAEGVPLDHAEPSLGFL
jgi:hypothetical protein